MSISITLTKVIVPRRSYHLLTRPRLLDTLTDLLNRRLTLIAAPAGYGKTSLLIDLAASVEYPVCWFALDPLDQNIHRFITHFIASIQQRFSYFGEKSSAVLQSMRQSELNLDHLVTTIVNDVYEHVSEHFAIVLDDYHLIETSEEVNYFINRFGQEMDENCHLVIASRSLLSLPDLPIMVGRSQVMGLGFEELVFSSQEIRALLQRNYDQSISEAEAKKLVHETEGWITGLLLSAEAMWKGMADRVRVARVSGVNIYDYLAQQVLDQQSPQVKDFLLRTSLIEEFNAQICETVLGQTPNGTDWHKLIETVLHHNLFVQPVENGGTWLRYHHLFRDFLQEQLSKEQPQEEDRLLRKLVDVYIEREEWEKAYSICQRLGDVEFTIDFINHAISPLARAGQSKTLIDWYDSLPSGTLATHPFLTAVFGSLALDLGDADKALPLLKQAEKALRKSNDRLSLARTLTWKANAYLNLGHYQISLEIIDEALHIATAKNDTQIAHAEALKVKGLTLYWIGQAQESISWLAQSLDLYRTLDDEANAAIVQLSLGLVYMNIGRQSQALINYQQALNLWRQTNNISKQATLLNNMGVTHHLGGDLLKAKNCFDEALEYARQSSLPRAEAFTLTSLGDLYVDLGFHDAAREHYQLANQIALQYEIRFLLLYLGLAGVRIMRIKGDYYEAKRAITQLTILALNNHSSYESALLWLEKGSLMIALGEIDEAVFYLKDAAEEFKTGGYIIKATLSFILLALAAHLEGEKDKVHINLSNAAQAAFELESLYPIAIAEKDMLRELKDYGAAEIGEFVQNLLNKIEEIEQERPRLRKLIREQNNDISISPPVLNVETFGEMLVELNGEPVTVPEWSNQRMVRELFFLLLEHPKGMTKEAIGDTLWPGSELHLLQKRFNNAIYRLRRSLGKETIFLDPGSGRYQFNWEMDYCYDVESFRTKLEHARNTKNRHMKIDILKDAVEMYSGTYLHQVEGTWSAPIREDLRRAYGESSIKIAEHFFKETNFEEAMEYCNRVFLADQYQEAAHRLAMRIYAAKGERPGVIQQYESIKQALQTHFGISPSAETKALVEELLGK